jgi:hypothetical protein
MDPDLKENCESIDAAMFSGDSFFAPEARKELREYLERWERELKRWDEADEWLLHQTNKEPL